MTKGTWYYEVMWLNRDGNYLFDGEIFKLEDKAIDYAKETWLAIGTPCKVQKVTTELCWDSEED